MRPFGRYKYVGALGLGMRKLYNAVVDAQHKLNQQDLLDDRAVGYVHPETLDDFLADLEMFIPAGERPKVAGMALERSAGVPKNTVVLVHVEAARYGPKAIAFGKIDEN